MDDELDTVGGDQTDLEFLAVLAGADQHRELIKGKDSYRISVGMEHVVIADPMLPSTRQNDGIHLCQYNLTLKNRPANGCYRAGSDRVCSPGPSRHGVSLNRCSTGVAPAPQAIRVIDAVAR